MFKKISVSIILLLLLASSFFSTTAQAKFTPKEEEGKVYIFTSPTCPHCTSAKNFLDNLKKQGDVNFSYQEYTISNNTKLANDFYKEYNVSKNQQGLIPVIFVGDQYFVGFSNQIGEQIKNILTLQSINNGQQIGDGKIGEDEGGEKSRLIKIPILGEVDLLNFSLPILAITLGIVDGFNVCSLGALVIILGLVMVLGSRKRIILMGGAFILTTGIVYGLLIFLWHQFFTLIAPFIRSMEVLIGVLSLVGGIYLLREFYKAYKSGPVCSSNNLMSRLTPKVERIFKNKTNWLVLLSTVVLFALIITIVEFPCSAVLPVIFTSILVESGVSFNASLGYIALFLLFYLLDEVIIFTIAVMTMRIKIVSPKFIIFFNLLAASIFIFIGAYYIFGLLS